MTNPLSRPKRIQLRRTKGWRKPEGAVVVARPSVYGNPWRVLDHGAHGCEVVGPPFAASGLVVSKRTAAGIAVEAFRRALKAGELDITEGCVRDTLAGHDLACWCRLDQPCHADVLLEVANQ